MAPPDEALLRLLLELDEGEGVALTRLAKRLDERVSVLLRRCTALSDAVIGGVAGPGWLRLQCDDAGRWVAWPTPAGRAVLGEPS
ncbi:MULTISPECIES: hypothetical protein [Roseateles]|uniref:Uncharacterized protein n=1 Tax=Pelomonas caseinilytica TaxID=2906763 RepID=A0ABS8XBW2_9BURK|nr:MULTISPECIES: hypothetical protein [unclassified Roseateles]MCE4537200.1 hypothetical protein [Pelomonas sp. P7]HEV6964136.1 hypothetical protein [Roseateles sp.]